MLVIIIIIIIIIIMAISIIVTFWDASVSYFGMLDGMCFTIRNGRSYIS